MANTDEKTTPEYEQFRELFTRRMSMRDLRPDPVPDTYVDKILEAAAGRCRARTPSLGSSSLCVTRR